MIHGLFSESSVIAHNSLARAGADQDRIGSKSSSFIRRYVPPPNNHQCARAAFGGGKHDLL